VSDHSIISAQVNVSMSQPRHVSYVDRNDHNMDLDEFRRRLLECEVCVNPSTSTNEYARQLDDCIVAILDYMAPSKMITKRRGKPIAGWMSKEAADVRRERRRLERRYCRTKTEFDWKEYRSSCQSTNKLINKPRGEYIGVKLSEAGSDSRKRRRITNDLLYNDHHRASFDIDDSQEMCNKFSQFFANKVRTIAQTIADPFAAHLICSTSHSSQCTAKLRLF